MLRQLTVATALVATTLTSISSAAEWSTLRGRIVYDGPPPTPKRVTVDKDKEVCGKFDIFEESLVVHRDNHGVRDVVVRLMLKRGETVAIHDSYQSQERGDVPLNNLHCRFDPHVAVLRTTQKLVLHNLDPKGDNVNINTIANTPINVTIPSGTMHTHTFPQVERMPARVSCSIHTWELGWLVVSDHPYVAVTDEDGNFVIENLPAGAHEFMFWQEKAGYLGEVTRDGQKQVWRKGTQEFQLRPGDNDLGDIVVQPDLFK